MPSSGDDIAHTVRAALLVSRQPLRPCRADVWVQKVIEAVSWVKYQHFTLLSAIGRPTWDLITAAGSLEKTRQDIITPEAVPDRIQSLRDQFNLSADLTAFSPLNCRPAHESGTTDHILDEAVLDSADLLIPISIRTGGFMDLALEKAEAMNQPILWNFYSAGPARSTQIAYSLANLPTNPALVDLENQYVVHWTRATGDRWPDERKIDFYRALLSAERYPRTALDTLSHILDCREILASSRHMPESIPTVCFSSLSPRDLIPLIRWRARYSQMSFEPYGIGIRKTVAFHLGIHPVTYFELSHRTESTDSRTWLRQSVGQKSDWRQEKEHRHLGNLNLRKIDHNDIVVFCRTASEASHLRQKFAIQVVPILGG